MWDSTLINRNNGSRRVVGTAWLFVQSTAERRKTKQSSGHIVRLLAPKSTRVVSLINSGRTRTPYMLHCSPGTRSRLVSVRAQWKFHHIRQIYLFHTAVANVDEPLRRGGVERTLEARMFRGPPLCVRRLNSNSKRTHISEVEIIYF